MPPPCHFTHYWANSTWAAYQATATRGELVDYAASNVFGERGVAAGDFLYIVTVLQGAVSFLTQRWLDLYGIKMPRQMGLALAHGSISNIFPFPGPKNLTHHYVFAASVLNGVSSRAVIESIGRELGALTRADQGIKNIETPLLGAGAGKLEPDVSGAALYSGFVEARFSAPPALFRWLGVPVGAGG